MGNDLDLTEKLSALVNTKPNESAVDYVINSFKELLLNKELKPGDRIPSEMELAKIFSVSRGSIREAMKILSSFGLVDIRRGDGTYIPGSGDNVSFDSVLFSFILTQPTEAEVYELRMMLENDVMELAMKKANEEDLRKLSDNIKRMKIAAEGKQDYHELAAIDLQFHETLAEMTENRLLKKIYSLSMRFFTPSVQESHRNQDYNAAGAITDHEAMLKALKSGDLKLAKEAVKTSIDTWERLISKKDQ